MKFFINLLMFAHFCNVVQGCLPITKPHGAVQNNFWVCRCWVYATRLVGNGFELHNLESDELQAENSELVKWNCCILFTFRMFNRIFGDWLGCFGLVKTHLMKNWRMLRTLFAVVVWTLVSSLANATTFALTFGCASCVLPTPQYIRDIPTSNKPDFDPWLLRAVEKNLHQEAFRCSMPWCFVPFCGCIRVHGFLRFF